MLHTITFVAGVVGFLWLAVQWARVVGRQFMLASDGSLPAKYKVPPVSFFYDKLLGAWFMIALTDTLVTLNVMRMIVKAIPSASAAYIGAVIGLAVSVLFRVALGGRLTGPKAPIPRYA